MTNRYFSALLALAVTPACGSRSDDVAAPGPGGSGKADWLQDPIAVLDIHDVSVLLPLPTWSARGQLLDVRATGRGGPLLSRELFVELTDEGADGTTLQQDIDPSLATGFFYDDGLLRVVSVRFDPCFRGNPSGNAECQAELRLVVQPIVRDGDQVSTMDAALHLAYAVSEDEFYDGIVPSLIEINERFGDRYCQDTNPMPGGETAHAGCMPLGVHPVVADQSLDGQYAQAIYRVIRTYAGSGNLSRMTFMNVSEAGGTDWEFGAFDVFSGLPGEQLMPVPVPTLVHPDGSDERQQFKAVGTPQNPNAASSPELTSGLQGILNGPMRQSLSREQLVASVVTASALDNPNRHAVETTDCASCHVAGRIRAFTHTLLDGDIEDPERFAPLMGWDISSSMDAADARNTINLRAFGYFGRVASISARTIHDSAATVEVLSQEWAARNDSTTPPDTDGGDGECEDPSLGCWSEVKQTPYFVVHGALLSNGKLLMYAGTAEQNYPMKGMVWDPETGDFAEHDLPEDLFCSGHALAADGSLLVAGGSSSPGSGISKVHRFVVDDGVSGGGRWTEEAPMHENRWYSTLVNLADGGILAVSGRTSKVEAYRPAESAWLQVEGADAAYPELYPILHLLPSGHVYYSRGGWEQSEGSATRVLTFDGDPDLYRSGSWQDAAPAIQSDRQEGMGVFFVDSATRESQIVVVGGGTGSTDARTVEALDVPADYDPGEPPAWRALASMVQPRTNVNVVMLPTGDLLALGGHSIGSRWAIEDTPPLEAEIYSREDDTWTELAAMHRARRYHSIAVLLPDGRVVTAGGVQPALGGAPERDQRDMQIFSPPYFMSDNRPTITESPDTADYGSEIDVRLASETDPSSIKRVALLRPMAVTHQSDANQRYITLPFTVVDGGLRVELPSDGRIAPPGSYLLAVVDNDDIPSVMPRLQLR